MQCRYEFYYVQASTAAYHNLNARIGKINFTQMSDALVTNDLELSATQSHVDVVTQISDEQKLSQRFRAAQQATIVLSICTAVFLSLWLTFLINDNYPAVYIVMGVLFGLSGLGALISVGLLCYFYVQKRRVVKTNAEVL